MYNLIKGRATLQNAIQIWNFDTQWCKLRLYYLQIILHVLIYNKLNILVRVTNSQLRDVIKILTLLTFHQSTYVKYDVREVNS